MHKVIKELQKEIKAVDKPANRMNYQRWFKEKLKHPIGLKTPVLREISNRVFKTTVRPYAKDEILDFCDEMLRIGDRNMRFFAFDWAKKLSKHYDRKDFVRFETWLKKYVDNWGGCDRLCGPIGLLLVRFPDLSPKRMGWTSSSNIWLRRASAVCLIEPVQEGLLLNHVFNTVEKLLMDEEDLVQKGYGWLLKVTGDHYFENVHAFVMKHKNRMPRTALRYAIEKWPEANRRQAMQKD